jgi:hypothetical protein
VPAKQILRNINVMNLLLIGIAAFFAGYAIFPGLTATVMYQLPQATRPLGVKQEIAKADIVTPPLIEYAVLSDKYLFHPDRKVPAQKVDIPKPEFVLYGTLISNGIKFAYIEDKKAPRSTPGRGNRQTPVREGQIISGFTVKEITAESVTLVKDEVSISVRVTDRSLKKR